MIFHLQKKMLMILKLFPDTQVFCKRKQIKKILEIDRCNFEGVYLVEESFTFISLKDTKGYIPSAF